MGKLNHIRLRRVGFLFAFCLVHVLAQCMGKEQATDVSTTDFLTQDLGERISRTSEVRVFVGESLWEYINGDAELYHQYHFVEVATADYSQNELEFVVDVYRFADSVNAYGLYTAIRPDQLGKLTTEVIGFAAETAVTFFKGDFVVQLIGFVDSQSSQRVLQEIAAAIEAVIPGSSAIPTQFTLFPANNKITASDRIYGDSFQGQSFLTEFFSQNYEVEGDTITLFLSEHEASTKLDQWIESVSQEIDTNLDLSGLSFDSDRNVALHTFSGTVVAGLRGRYLAGMINYSDDERKFLEDWLNSLSEQPL